MKFKIESERHVRFLRFIFGGVINTALTMIVYLVLSRFLNYQLSYLVAFVVGVLFAYLFNSAFVFRVERSVKSFLIYPLMYIFQYGISAMLLWVLVGVMMIDHYYAPIIVTAFMVPVTYFLNKVIFR